jgi:polar amino acid transport system ATP-binding protein
VLGFAENAKVARERMPAAVNRQIGMMFQQFNLWSHMTALGQRRAEDGSHKMNRRDAEERAMARLAKVGLEGRALSLAAFGRAAAARCHRPRPCPQLEDHAL